MSHGRDGIPKSAREVRRPQLLGVVVEWKLTLVSASEKLGLSYRQA